MAARRARLPDGRWHLQHGPIDCIVGADGERVAVDAAHDAAWMRFVSILDELVAELPMLKRAIDAAPAPAGPVARRMHAACRMHRPRFITPMAAVAGAVADELVGHYRRAGVDRAWINNGGDIALHLAPGRSVRIGLFADLAAFPAAFSSRALGGEIAVDGRFDVTHAMPVRGIATSGWRGRSFSLGIADSVTVLAATAAAADAAATMIANAVDTEDSRIVRRPASALVDDSDLEDRLVTVDVPLLGLDAVRGALSAGAARADALVQDGTIGACFLTCQGQSMVSAAPRTARGAAARTGAGGSRGDFAWHGNRLMEPTMDPVA